MFLSQLFESNGTVGIIFGRFNPPHKGHKAAWMLASQNAAWYVGTNQNTQGPKDPLPYDVKVEAMETIWPELAGHIVPEQSWLTLASAAYKQHGDATLICYTDEDWVTKTIQQYNGKEGAHGYYNFPLIKQHATPRLSSATALRDAVAAGDRDAFTKAAGVDADTPVAGTPFFDLVAQYLVPVAAKKVAKPKAVPVEEPVAEGNELSDAAQARELIGRALRNQNERQKYFDFIKYLINKHGKDYGTNVHQLASKLAKEGQDGMAGVGMGNYGQMEETVLRDKEDLQAKRKALQDIQMDKDTHKDPELAAAVVRRKDALEKEAKAKGINETAAWQKSSGKNKNGGLNQKGVDSYRKEHPGSKLQTAVTKKPSELKPGSKDAKRRKSFCARMGGSKGPMKKPNGEPTRKALALRKWHCESIEDMAKLIETAEKFLAEARVEEKWTKKYKDSINCSNPKGFSQKAHCAGKKKNEETEVEEAKQRLDPKCWKGYKKQGTKMKGDTRVNNCVPVDESIEDIMSKAIALLETKNK